MRSLKNNLYDVSALEADLLSEEGMRDCGGLVSDKRGERSCLNYILVRKNR